MTEQTRTVRVFLAEDNRADVYLVEMALKEHQIPFALRLVEDGDEALRVVERFGQEEPVPDIALLDLNLPRQEGDQIVRRLRQHPCCGSMPIVIMTSSDSDRDRAMAKTYNAVFFSKPADLSGFLELGSLVKELCNGKTFSV
jgi:chemotaxis family two-component system response regulator Rcp1